MSDKPFPGESPPHPPSSSPCSAASEVTLSVRERDGRSYPPLLPHLAFRSLLFVDSRRIILPLCRSPSLSSDETPEAQERQREGRAREKERERDNSLGPGGDIMGMRPNHRGGGLEQVVPAPKVAEARPDNPLLVDPDPLEVRLPAPAPDASAPLVVLGS